MYNFLGQRNGKGQLLVKRIFSRKGQE